MDESRRSFLRWMTHGLGILFTAVLGVPAVIYLIDPRNRKAAEGSFRTVARLSELVEAGKPVQAVIHETRQDAWTVHPNDEIGRVWLLYRGKEKVDAFTTICPHLGCSVNLKPDGVGFLCPCHTGTFDLNGKLVSGPPPRGMDQLQVKLVEDPDPTHEVVINGEKKRDRLVQVEYKSFIQNIADKTEKK